MKDEWWDDVCRENPWAVWCPDEALDAWYPFSAELAAKYSSQGCLVRLFAGDDELERLPRPRGNQVDPDPDKPPFSPQEIVWNERASRYSKVYLPRWRKIAAWVKRETGRDPMAVVSQWREVLGEWGGASNLVKMDAERESRWGKAVPV